MASIFIIFYWKVTRTTYYPYPLVSFEDKNSSNFIYLFSDNLVRMVGWISWLFIFLLLSTTNYASEKITRLSSLFFLGKISMGDSLLVSPHLMQPEFKVSQTTKLFTLIKFFESYFLHLLFSFTFLIKRTFCLLDTVPASSDHKRVTSPLAY